jgi:hypothetical protein
MTSLNPGIDQAGAIAVGNRELTALPERLVEIGVENLEEVAVDVGEEVLLGPLKSKCVLLCSICVVESAPLYVCAPPSIVRWVGTPFESRRCNVVSSLFVGVVVSSGLHNINFSGQWPWTVSVIHWQHPNSRP